MLVCCHTSTSPEILRLSSTRVSAFGNVFSDSEDGNREQMHIFAAVRKLPGAARGLIPSVSFIRSSGHSCQLASLFVATDVDTFFLESEWTVLSARFVPALRMGIRVARSTPVRAHSAPRDARRLSRGGRLGERRTPGRDGVQEGRGGAALPA